MISEAATSLFLKSNLKHVGLVIGGCNLVGFVASAAFETHKITDLVGVGSFVAAAVSLTLRNPAIFSRMKLIQPVTEGVEKIFQLGNFNIGLGTARVLIVNSIVIAWGVRLSTYLFHRVLKLGEDKRLDKFYKEKGESYLDSKKSLFPLKLGGFWLIQAAWGYLCCLPVIFLNSVPAIQSASATKTIGEIFSFNRLTAAFPLSMRFNGPLAVFKWIPVVTAVGGVILESLADYQKSAFRDDLSNKDKWCDRGVWRLCRYPNYFGEVLVWWSIYFLCVPALPLSFAVCSLASPLTVTFLITRVSGIPLLETKNDKKFEGNNEYKKYKDDVPMIVPNFKSVSHYLFSPYSVKKST